MKKNKANKKFLGKKKTVVPKTAQKTIPFREAYENCLFLNDDGSYSLIFSFDNVDYSLFRDEEKKDIYEKYMGFLNSIPTSIRFQEFLMNMELDVKTLKETLQSDSQEYPEIAEDYNKVVEKFISGGSSAGERKIMLMAMSYHPVGKIDNANVLFEYYQSLEQVFNGFGSSTRLLSPEKVFALLYQYYHQFSNIPFVLPENVYGSRIKNYITPAYFRFNKQDIEIGDQLTRILFIKDYSTHVDDEIINDLIDNNKKITVSKHIRHVSKGEGMQRLQKKIFNLETTIQKRMEQNKKAAVTIFPIDSPMRENIFMSFRNGLAVRTANCLKWPS